MILAAPELPAGCDRETETCRYFDPSVAEFPSGNTRPPTDEERADLAARRDQAGTSITQPRMGLGIAISGALIMTGGLVWHLLEPGGAKKVDSKEARARLRATPWVSAGGGGLVAGGTF